MLILLRMVTRAPWFHPRPDESGIHLDIVPESVLHALAAGETDSLALPYASSYLQGPDCVWLWRIRSAQIKETSGDAAWIARLVIDPEIDVPVGLAGFHAAPDAVGMVEVSYQVAPEFRRHGYARRSLDTLLAIAEEDPDVRTVRATIGPNNAASLALISGYGFIEHGEQWDEEDGREIIFEVPA